MLPVLLRVLVVKDPVPKIVLVVLVVKVPTAKLKVPLLVKVVFALIPKMPDVLVQVTPELIVRDPDVKLVLEVRVTVPEEIVGINGVAPALMFAVPPDTGMALLVQLVAVFQSVLTVPVHETALPPAMTLLDSNKKTKSVNNNCFIIK